MLFVHYNDLKADLPGEMRRISAFLGIETPPDRLTELAAAATFEAMTRDGEALLPHTRDFLDNGPERFLFKGANGRWRDFLTGEDLARYDALIRAKLPPAMARWVERGRAAAGDPKDIEDERVA